MTFTDFLGEYVENLQIEGDLAFGKIDGTEKFDTFRIELRKFGYSFTTRSSRKENYSFEEGPQKKLPGRGSLMYKSSSDVSVPFFGYPFVVETTTYYTCSQGLKYYASKRYPDELFREGDPLAKKRRRPKVTQKIGCQARMTVKKIKVFCSDEYAVTRDNWREKKAAIDVLRNDLEQNNKVESFLRYYLLISLDTMHNHNAVPRAPAVKVKPQINPVKKVIRLQDSFMEALEMLNSDLVYQCTNTSTLAECCTNLKTIISNMRNAVKNEEVSPEMVAASRKKTAEKQNKQSSSPQKRKDVNKRLKVEGDLKDEIQEEVPYQVVGDPENVQIELPPGVLDGSQILWDPSLNVSYVLDSQGVVLQQEDDESRDGKPSIFIQRRVNDPNNLGVITQGGQNYTILQHGGVSSIQPSALFSLAKVVSPGAPAGSKRSPKKNEIVTIALPPGVDWAQQNWAQPMVVPADQFVASQPVWNITQS